MFGVRGLGGAAIGLGGLLLAAVPFVLQLDEALGLGALFALRGAVSPPERAVIVGISRDAAAAVGQSDELDEWPRMLHAELVDALRAAGARTVAFDLFFDEPRADDSRLASAFERAGNVVLGERVLQERVRDPDGAFRGLVETRVPPVPELREAALATAPFSLPVVPFRVGQFWTFGPTGDRPSLPAVAVQAYLLDRYADLRALLVSLRPELARLPESQEAIHAAHDLADVMSAIRSAFRASPELAADARRELESRPEGEARSVLGVLLDLYSGPASRYLNYYGPARTIRTVPYDVALRHAEGGTFDGKMVFVGGSEPRQPEQQDDFHSVFSEQSGENLSGVEIGATAFANLLERRSLRPLPMPAHLLLVLVFGTALGWLALRGSVPLALLTVAAFVAAYLAFAYWQLVSHALWWPLFVPIAVQAPVAALAAVAANYVRIARQRERVQSALGFYVPRAVVRRLAERSVDAAADRQLLHGTCLFTDVEDYTSVSERLRPEELASLMNDYYGVVFRVVTEHGGLVSDTSGDSMVAIWAGTEADAGLQSRACGAALAILDAVEEFNARRAVTRLPTRVGLDSGELLLGNIGAEQRFAYRAIGDIVNTAARLQGLNKLLGTRVLVSDATRAAARGFATRDVGVFLLRGKAAPIRVHELLGADREPSGDTERFEAFAAALASFERERWDEAAARFTALARAFPSDGPSAYYAARSAELVKAPPAAWPGAIVVATK